NQVVQASAMTKPIHSQRCTMRKWLPAFAFLLMWLTTAPMRADEKHSTVSMEPIKVTALKGGQFEVELKAIFRLGANDMLIGQQCWFVDPNNKEIVPECKFEAPKAGKSSNLTMKFTTTTRGDWKKGSVRMIYKTEKGFDGEATASTEFKVP